MDDDKRRSAIARMAFGIAKRVEETTSDLGTDILCGSNTEEFTRLVLFVLFSVSGFSGLVYQVVWVRLAFASFGITTPVLSMVVSVFMLFLHRLRCAHDRVQRAAAQLPRR